mgnify:FL=1
MRIILLSGGSGHRLWPLSSDARAKQFLKVLRGKNGMQESMLQHLLRMLEEAGLSGRAMIAANRTQLDFIRQQAGHGIPVIAEPERRDTFPAISLASSYLYSVQKIDPNETVAILPVDLIVDRDFFDTLKELDRIISASSDEAEIGLIGIKPDHPSVNYGYILPDLDGNKIGSAYKIRKFAEKPDPETAKGLIGQQALWNNGVFVFRLATMIRLLEARNFPIQYEELRKAYESLPRVSFDYEVAEKASNLIAVPYGGTWKDIGNWKSLTEIMDVDILGHGIKCEASHNTHIVNELGIPVAVVGLSDSIVAVSREGILVADKTASVKIKNLMPAIRDLAAGEHSWGWARVLEHFRPQDDLEVLIRRVFIRAGRQLDYMQHDLKTGTWNILSGEGEMVSGGLVRKVHAGDTLKLPGYAIQAIRAVTDLMLIEIQQGSGLTEENAPLADRNQAAGP